MQALEIPEGSLVVDSQPFSTGGTADQAKALAEAGVVCLVGYLGSMNTTRLGYLFDAGVGFMPVTYGMRPDQYNGPGAVAACKALGLVPGVCVWLDMEGLPAWNTNPDVLDQDVDAWCEAPDGEGYVPSLYVGVPQPLNSQQLWERKVRRYWHGQGCITDRQGHASAPQCGYVMTQLYPSVWVPETGAGRVWVDKNTVQKDGLGRLPVMAAP